MVYKIRNKAFGAFFSSGASNRILYLPKQQLNPEISKHLTLQVQITRFNQMRTLHNYRNISRATKQFLNGDKMLENLMIMTIQGQYYRPNHYKAPIEQSYMIVSSRISLYQVLTLCWYYIGTYFGWLDWQTLWIICCQPTPHPTGHVQRVQPVLGWLARHLGNQEGRGVHSGLWTQTLRGREAPWHCQWRKPFHWR